jgi:hypothetical protein
MEMLTKGFFYFILICAPITMCYFAAVMMFPDFDKDRDLGTYFHQNFKIIGIITASFILVNLAISLALGSASLFSATSLIRLVNGLLILIVATLNLQKWILPLGLFIALALIIGSIKIALN